MFRKGDKVVCVKELYSGLKKNNIYTIERASSSIILLEEIDGYFRPEKFLTLKEYRKKKLNKICSNKEMK